MEYLTIEVEWSHLQDVLNSMADEGWAPIAMQGSFNASWFVVLEREGE